MGLGPSFITWPMSLIMNAYDRGVRRWYHKGHVGLSEGELGKYNRRREDTIRLKINQILT